MHSEFQDLLADGVKARDSAWVDESGVAHPVGLDREPLRYLPWGIATTGEFGYWLVSGDDPDQWPALLTDLGGRWMWGGAGLAQLIMDTQDGRYPGLVEPVDVPPSFVRLI